MANELAVQLALRFSKTVATGNLIEISRSSGSKLVTIAGTRYVANVQNVGFAAAEAIDLGDVGTPGYMIAHNASAANFVQIGYDSGGFKPLVKLQPDQWALFPLAQAAPQAQADTGAVNLEYVIVEA